MGKTSHQMRFVAGSVGPHGCASSGSMRHCPPCGAVSVYCGTEIWYADAEAADNPPFAVWSCVSLSTLSTVPRLPPTRIQSPTCTVDVNDVPVPVTIALPLLGALTLTVPAPLVVEGDAFGSNFAEIWNGLTWMWNGCEIGFAYVSFTTFHSSA